MGILQSLYGQPWKSCGWAARVPQQDEREEAEGSANPQQGGEPVRPIGAKHAAAVEIRTPQVGLSCPDGRWQHTLLTGESCPLWPWPRIWGRSGFWRLIAWTSMLAKIYRIRLYKRLNDTSWPVPVKYSILVCLIWPHSILLIVFHLSTHFLELERAWKIPVIIILPSIFSEQRLHEAVFSHLPCGKDLKLLQLTCTKNWTFFFLITRAFSQGLCWRLVEVQKLHDIRIE